MTLMASREPTRVYEENDHLTCVSVIRITGEVVDQRVAVFTSFDGEGQKQWLRRGRVRMVFLDS